MGTLEAIRNMPQPVITTGCLAHSDKALICNAKSQGRLPVHLDAYEIPLSLLRRNDSVLSYDVNTEKFICTKIVGQLMEFPEPIPFVNIIIEDDLVGLSNQTIVKLTEDHLIYILRENKPFAIAAKNVKKDDVLISALHT